MNEIWEIWDQLEPLLSRDKQDCMDPASRWDQAVAGLKALYSHNGSDNRFRIPADYDGFMRSVGRGWSWNVGLGGELLSATAVLARTSHDYRLFVLEHEEDERPLDTGLWLTVEVSGKHDVLLCCDEAHKAFASLYDAHDDHPYLGGLESPLITSCASFPACSSTWSKSFTDYLRHLAGLLQTNFDKTI